MSSLGFRHQETRESDWRSLTGRRRQFDGRLVAEKPCRKWNSEILDVAGFDFLADSLNEGRVGRDGDIGQTLQSTSDFFEELCRDTELLNKYDSELYIQKILNNA